MPDYFSRGTAEIVAQLVEHRPFKPRVVGSNPTGLTVGEVKGTRMDWGSFVQMVRTPYRSCANNYGVSLISFGDELRLKSETRVQASQESAFTHNEASTHAYNQQQLKTPDCKTALP